MVAVGDALDAVKTHVKRLECEPVIEDEKREKLSAECRETNQTPRRLLAVCEALLSVVQSELASVTAEKNEWYDHALEALEKLKVAEADITRQSTFREAARENIDTHTAEKVKLQGK